MFPTSFLCPCVCVFVFVFVLVNCCACAHCELRAQVFACDWPAGAEASALWSDALRSAESLIQNVRRAYEQSGGRHAASASHPFRLAFPCHSMPSPRTPPHPHPHPLPCHPPTDIGGISRTSPPFIPALPPPSSEQRCADLRLSHQPVRATPSTCIRTWHRRPPSLCPGSTFQQRTLKCRKCHKCQCLK